MKRYLRLIIFCFFAATAFAQEFHHDHSIHHAFIENKGQWPEKVLFKSTFHGGNMWVEQGRVLFHLQDFTEYRRSHANLKQDAPDELTFKQELIGLTFLGANDVKTIEKHQRAPHYYNFFIGNNPSRWASNVGAYSEFLLKNFYNGIDLRFIEKEGELKYEFIVAELEDPSQIILNYKNHKSLSIDKNGNLIVRTGLGDIIEEKPYAYQVINGNVREVKCDFEIKGDNVRFRLGEYNPKAQLVIDPTLVFSTFCGAVSDNFGMTATYGYDGTAYNGGMVYGNSYPTPDPNAWDVNSNLTLVNVGVVTTDAFISKYTADGTTMIWSTFFGGGDNTQGTEVPHSLICDLDDNIYVYGVTSALDFPIVNGFQPNHAGGTTLSVNFNGTNFGNVGTDIFVAKFSANGQNLLGSTYVGGSGNDGVNYKVTSGVYNTVAAYDSLTTNYGDQFRGEIMLDEQNNVIVASCTRSTNFPVLNAFQPNNAGMQDGVVFKIQNDFSALLFSSYYGGSDNDACYSVKLDEDENLIFVGGTNSLDLPGTLGGYQETYQGGRADGFVAKVSANGANLIQSTYMGMGLYDQVFFVEVDRLNNVFVVGQSVGGNFPVSPGVYSVPGGSQFIAKLTPDLTSIIQSSVFGSGNPNFDISPAAFLVDICGNMYVSGWGANILQSTPMGNMPVTPNAFQQTAPNGFDFYLIVIEREFGGLLYGTYMGGPISNEHVDGGTSRFDKNGVVYQGVCGGCGGNSDFPTTPGAWSSQNLASNCNALVFKFDFNLIPNAEFTVDNNLGCAPFEVTFTNFSSDSDSYIWDFGDGNTDSTTFEPTIIYTDPGVYQVFLYVTDSICLITDTAFLTITVLPGLESVPMAPFELCQADDITLIANSNGTATQFIWSSNPNFTDTLNASLSDSIAEVFGNQNGFYYVMLINPGCTLIDSVEVFFTSAALSLTGDTDICVDETTVITASSNDPSITFFNFDWSPNSIIVSGDGTASVTIAPTSTQYVVLTAESSNGCIITDSVLINVSNISASTVFAIASDSLVPEGSTVTLTATPSGSYTYTWSPPNNLTAPNSQVTDALVMQTTTYTVQVSDGICTRQASVEVKTYKFVCEEPFVYVPNAFTPNGDGNNDILYIRSTIIEEATLRIFNRWGEMVFETNDMLVGWDGTFRGRELPPDVYDYYLFGFCIDGEEFIIQGNITLIR
jgi:gliding motility-associated-like protein